MYFYYLSFPKDIYWMKLLVNGPRFFVFFFARSDDLLVGCFNMVSPNVACVLQVIYPLTKVSGHVARNFQ